MEEDSEKETRVVQTAGKSYGFGSLKIYVDYTLQDGEKVDWSIMRMDQSYLTDITDALRVDLENIERRIRQTTESSEDSSISAEIRRKLLDKKFRMKLLIKIIDDELDEGS